MTQQSKQARQAAILHLVRSERVESQQQLRRLLAGAGHRATQATLSRDLRELKVVKGVDGEGVLRYQTPATTAGAPFRCRVSGNLLVLHTEPGMAAPLAYRIDAAGMPEILGTVAGEDTVLAVLAEHSDGRRVRGELWERIGRI